MIDICLCTNEACPKKRRCYRFVAETNDVSQEYDEFVPDVDGVCASFLPLAGVRKPRTMRGRVDDEDKPVFDSSGAAKMTAGESPVFIRSLRRVPADKQRAKSRVGDDAA